MFKSENMTRKKSDFDYVSICHSAFDSMYNLPEVASMFCRHGKEIQIQGETLPSTLKKVLPQE